MDSTLFYHLALFLHIMGAFGLVAAMTFETIGLQGLRRAIEKQDAVRWLHVARVVQRLAPASLGLIVVMGLYLTATTWGARGWILVSLGGLVAYALIGGLLTGVRMARIGPAVGRASEPLSDDLRGARRGPGAGLGPARGRSSEPLSDDLRAALRDPVLLISIRTRLGIVLGIVLLMTLNPSLVALLLFLV